MASRLIWCVFFASAVVTFVGCGTEHSATPSVDTQLASRLEFRSPQSFLDVIEYEAAAYDDVAVCMKEQGFEYRPYTYTRELERFPQMIAAAVDPVEFASTYGYGVTDPDPFASFDAETFGPIDPDYDRALYGFTSEEMVADNLRPEGCWGDRIRPIVDASAAFEEARLDLAARIDADPDVTTATREWSRCMAEQGYDYESPEQAVVSFRDRWQQIRMTTGPGQSNEPFEALLDEEIAAALTDHTQCNGAELRATRNELATTIGLSDEATSALEVLTADDDPSG